MAKQYESCDDGWRISDEMWRVMEPLLPPPKPNPLRCHRPRLDNRVVLTGDENRRYSINQYIY